MCTSDRYLYIVGCCLTSWSRRKQTALAIPILKPNSVSVLERALSQALWKENIALIDYDVRLTNISIISILSFSLEKFVEFLGYLAKAVGVPPIKWALYELANGLPGDGPYQTFLPYLDDIITLVRVDREVLTHILNEEPELQNPSYVLYDVSGTFSSSFPVQKGLERDRGRRY
ncbi:hypothetical protein Tco_1516998 [Tanacetum coccineum]